MNMPTLTAEARQAAREGNISALRKLVLACKESPQQAFFLDVMDICLYNLRPELHPTLSSFQVSIQVHRQWLQMTMTCIWFIGAGISETLQSKKPSDMKGTYHNVRKRLVKYWERRIWPAILIVIDGYVLEDTQPSISEDDSQEVAFKDVTRLLTHLLDPDAFNIGDIMLETEGVPVRAGRLVFRFYDRYTHLRGQNFLLTHFAFASKAGAQINEETSKDLLADPRFFPVIVSLLKEERNAITTTGNLTPTDNVVTILTELIPSITPPPVASRNYQINRDNPELLDLLLHFWGIGLTILEMPEPQTQSVQSAALANTAKIMTRRCAETIYMHCHGGGYPYRTQSIRKHLFHLILRSSCLPERLGSSIWDAFADMIDESLDPLAHYSFLRVAVRALKDINMKGLGLPPPAS